jgi:DNA-directed RNA polymerase subunit RPC12/RpoP
MQVRCAWCKKDMGVKPPLNLLIVTHGICEDCERRILEKHAEVKRA